MDNSITQAHIDELAATSIKSCFKAGTKTAVMVATLPSGFEVTVSSACVDPANFDLERGREVCEQKLKDRLWELEGYRLQIEIEGA